MGLVRSLDKLDPRMAGKAKAFLQAAPDRLGFSLFVHETFRFQEVQDAYYAQGRKPLVEVNALRLKAGLWPITEFANRIKITNATRSYHSRGLAMDVYPSDGRGNPIWRPTPDAWRAIGALAMEFGFEWGGAWEPLDEFGIGWDPCHIQMGVSR